ncbi:MAG TPA: mechanosensitive ion channel family protein [Myxococcota bacterium]|nr:mechanosensitive ion channel family protein [Myxococcota bacterium]
MTPDPTTLALPPLLDQPWVKPVLVFVAFVSLATLVEQVAERLARRWLAGHTAEAALDHLVRPVILLISVSGVHYASLYVPLADRARAVLLSSLTTIAIVAGAWAVHHAAVDVLERVASSGTGRWVHRHTLPLYDMAVKVLLVTLALNLVFLAWHIDLTAWVASAGVLSVAVGFAAQETLSNLLAGALILTDRPFQIGDFLVLDDRTRGRVLDVGLRSTRLVTSDQTEVIVPNNQMASARVCNVSSGPLPYERFHVDVQVAYDTDLDRAAEILLGVAARLTHAVLDAPEAPPTVRYVSFDDSGITVRLQVFARPEAREPLIDEMIRSIHRTFRDEGVSIPFPQVVLHRT